MPGIWLTVLCMGASLAGTLTDGTCPFDMQERPTQDA